MRQIKTFSITKTAEELVPDYVSRMGYAVASGMTILMMLAIILLWGKLPRAVPLFFTEPWGEARLAPREFIWLLPGLSLLIIAANIAMGKSGSNASMLLPRTLSVVSGVVALMLLFSLYGILQSLFL